MVSAAVVTAGVSLTVFVVVMVTFYVGIILKAVCNKGYNGTVGAALYTAVKGDAFFLECGLCACTDMASFVDSLAAPMSVINALIVSIGLHRREELSAHFKRMEGIWNAQSVYISKEHE